MFKLFATVCLLGVILHLANNNFSQPPSVQAATNEITSITAKVQEAATESNQKASALGTALETHPANATERLKEFKASTERLTNLRERLQEDITTYHATATEALKQFDNEVHSINDPSITKNMAFLRRQTEEDQNDRERDAKQTISLLDEVLQKGSDLQHATNCVLIANDLHTTGETLNIRITDARHTATEYETSTNTLLNKISSVLAQK